MQTYRVRWAIDGNTIQALSQTGRIGKLRLAGIIAPPLYESLGETGKRVLERFLPRGIYMNVHVTGRDLENCLLAEVYVADDFINEKLVRLGLASVCPRQINQISQPEKLQEAENFAHSHHIGIYATHQPSRISDHYYICGHSVSIANQIPQVCRQKGLTTAYQLAMRCGIKRTTAYRLWDNPQAYPTRKTMTKLCDGLGVQPGELIIII